MSDRNRILALAAGATVLIGLGVLYLVWSVARVDDDIADREARAEAAIDEFEEQATTEPSVGSTNVEEAAATPIDEPVDRDPATDAGPGPRPGEVLVIHRVPGDDYGRLAIRHVDGSRTLLDRRCLRVHVAAARGVCLADAPGLLGLSWNTEFFDASDDRLDVYREYPSPLPSRVRLSPDGERMSMTGFVSGTSYADVGTDTETITTIDETGEQGRLIGLVQFKVADDDPRYDTFDRQYWGVSWVDNVEFFVTGYFGEEPEILRGNLRTRRLTPVGWMGSCPSVSPDGNTIVYKATQPDGTFLLSAVDVETGEDWQLGETRSVDDQVEWLDDDTILYALHPDGTDGTDVQPQFDIWSLDITEGAEPELFLPAADSPAVVR